MKISREDALRAVRTLLMWAGEDPDREGLKDTPERVVRSYAELFSGYWQDPSELMTVFDEPCDEMVLVRGIKFTSLCEHHMLPFTGVAHVAYLPQGRVIGLSKLARLVDLYARRFQVQERRLRVRLAPPPTHVQPAPSRGDDPPL